MPKIEFLEYLFLFNSFGKFIFKSDQTKDESIPINRTQEKTLMHIANCGPVPMKNVSARFGLEKGSFTQVADDLERMRYIRRVRSHQDRRMILLEITPQGRDMADLVNERIRRHVDQLLSVLTPEQKEDLFFCLKKVGDYLETIRKQGGNYVKTS